MKFMNLRLSLSLVLFLLGSSLLNAQYLNSSPTWNLNRECVREHPCHQVESYGYYLNGDTIIDGTEYKKVYRSGVIDFVWMSSSPVDADCVGSESLNTPVPVAYLRESNNKFFLFASGKDTLLMDFNLSVGSQVPLSFINDDPSMTVSSIDTIINDSIVRRRFYLQGNSISPGVDDYILEGIGSAAGLLEHLPSISMFNDCTPGALTCFMVGSSPLFTTDVNSCNNPAIIYENNNVDFEFYPNPSNSEVLMKGYSSGAQVSIYDLNGRIVYEGPCVEKLNISHLPASLYFLKISNEKYGKSFKLIKTKS